MTWITIQTVTRIHWISWLNGAAGSGKSAIGRSIVDICLSQSIPITRFFFFRTDSTRNDLKPVVATLVDQLIKSIPELWPIIIPRIEVDPLIFTKSLETQFRTLIFEPLLQLQSESSTPPKTVVLLFDGVDECNRHGEQAKLIQTVTNFIKKQSFPIIAFFGSRAENQLSTEFRSPELSNILLQFSLDTDYRADKDIRQFFNDSLMKIKSTHPFGSDLRYGNWPALAVVDELVHKASGQFIYASVVMTFISTTNQDPAQQLEIVRGLRPSGSLTPFAQLDALYRHIFSQVADKYATSLILAWELFTQDVVYRSGNGRSSLTKFTKTDRACGIMTNTEIKVALASLNSVLTYTIDGSIKFLHASLPDFLRDPKRSHEYCIDQAYWCTQLSILTLRRMISMAPSKLYTTRNGKPKLSGAFAILFQRLRIVCSYPVGACDFVTMVESYLPHANLTAELKEHVAALKPDVHWQNFDLGSIDRYFYNRPATTYIVTIQKWVRNLLLHCTPSDTKYCVGFW